MSRTLEEILAYSRETGMDWALTAEEAGLLRREVERLSVQLAEERAGREGLERTYADFTASYTGMLRDYRKRADQAERELAEERAKKCDYRAEYETEYGKRTVAEARIAKLQALVDAATTFEFDGPGGTFYADTWYTDKPVEVWCVFDVAENGDPQNVKSDLARDEAIALARDLAAKEKEPT